MTKKLGPKKIAKSKLRKRLNCTVDPDIKKRFERAVKAAGYASVSRAVDVALAGFCEK